MSIDLDDSKNAGLIAILGQPAIGRVMEAMRDLVEHLDVSDVDDSQLSASIIVELLDPEEEPLASYIELIGYLEALAVEGNVSVRLEKYKHGLSTKPAASRKARQELSAVCQSMRGITQQFEHARRMAQRQYAEEAIGDIEYTTSLMAEVSNPRLTEFLRRTRQG